MAGLSGLETVVHNGLIGQGEGVYSLCCGLRTVQHEVSSQQAANLTSGWDPVSFKPNNMDTLRKDRKKKLCEVLLRPFRISHSDNILIRRPIHTVKGHFSLTEIRGAKFPGRQTAATSLCALLQATTLCPSSWSAEVIDRLLLQGDKLHSTRVRHLNGRNSGPEKGILKPEQLPTNFNSGRTDFTIRLKKVPSGLSLLDKVKIISGEQSLQTQSQCLQKQLRPWLTNGHAGVLMTVNDVTFVLSFSDEHYYLFHPCMYVNKRFYNLTQGSMLMKFLDLDHMCGYVCNKVVPETVTYELMVVDIVTELDKWTHLTLCRKAS